MTAEPMSRQWGLRQLPAVILRSERLTVNVQCQVIEGWRAIFGGVCRQSRQRQDRENGWEPASHAKGGRCLRQIDAWRPANAILAKDCKNRPTRSANQAGRMAGDSVMASDFVATQNSGPRHDV